MADIFPFFGVELLSFRFLLMHDVGCQGRNDKLAEARAACPVKVLPAGRVSHSSK